MSSKKDNSNRSSEILEQEDVLQALVIADSFNRKFLPLTVEKPRVLLPLVNIPLIDYTIEFLASSGVQEIFVFCCAHADQIKDHVNSSKWNQSNSPCTITTIVSDTCTSMGDAIREMESKKGVLRSHFILVNGDVISNMQLKDIVEIHKKRFLEDKSTVMTLINKQAKPGHRTRNREEEFLMVTGPSGRVLNFQRLQGKRKLKLPLNLFQEHSSMTVRHDLIDTHICVCTPRVVELFVDNFDYKTKNDFIRGLLINEEIEGNKLFLHVLRDEYATRVANLPLYDSVSKDMIHRWVFPVVPEHISPGGYSLRRHNQYLAKDVSLGRDCVLDEDVLVGSNTVIGDNTFISHSVIGSGCKIGSNVRLENAYLWDGVTVEDDCSVTFSILCNNVLVKSGSTIQKGCILSFQVVVGPDIIIQHGTLLTSRPQSQVMNSSDDFEETETSDLGNRDEIHPNPAVVGAEGKGHVWLPQEIFGEDEEEAEDLVGPPFGLNVSLDASCYDDSGDDSDEDSYISPSSSPPPDDTALFFFEVLESIQRTMEENVKVDNLILEVNSSKHAYNISIQELNQLVMKAVLELPHIKGQVKPAPLLQTMKKIVKKLSPLFLNYFKNAASQLDCLRVIQEHCSHNSSTLAILPKFLLMFYEEDVLAEEVILSWYQQVPSSDQVHKVVTPFITWLQEADEESEEEDD
ncbi:translation initiation factor eIF2B subunit epsilon-like [Apostichopus japonicus]|uniref:translation initiation factor eIF2B subunit epsilon-like n=1 Tax=Stichopus japonicus TaxID=307972 RepID=UPI003AB47525